MVGAVALAGEGDHLGGGGVHGGHLGVDGLLVRVPLGLLPSQAGRVVPEGRQLGLLVEEVVSGVDGVLASRYGRHESLLRLREELADLRVLGLNRGGSV